MNLEQYVIHIYATYESEIKRDNRMNKQLENLLKFMVDNGSQTAAAMLEKL